MSLNSNERLVVSVEEARQLLGLSRGLMYDAVRRGEIPSVKVGRRILIPRAALQKMLEGNSVAKGHVN
jgi:excisionase family DNA binding protein